LLDNLLVQSACAAGAEFRPNFVVDELTYENGRVTGIRGRSANSNQRVTEQARIVIGADGRQSVVALRANAEKYAEYETLTCVYYAFFEGLDCRELEQYARAGAGLSLIPTNDSITVAAFMAPLSRFREIKSNPRVAFEAVAAHWQEVAARVATARLQGRFVGIANIPNYFRKPFGPGWALVGDAGHCRDPITGNGISDAFRQAEILVASLHASWSGHDDTNTILSRYENNRNEEEMPSYEWTLRVAQLRPLGNKLSNLLSSIKNDSRLVSLFLGLNAGTVAMQTFFADPELARAFDS
jgi:flavin-dependent dehydrogenase